LSGYSKGRGEPGERPFLQENFLLTGRKNDDAGANLGEKGQNGKIELPLVEERERVK